MKGAALVVAALVVYGMLHTATEIGEEATTMQGQHWIMLVVVLLVGYAAGRLFPQPARMVGLP